MSVFDVTKCAALFVLSAFLAVPLWPRSRRRSRMLNATSSSIRPRAYAATFRMKTRGKGYCSAGCLSANRRPLPARWWSSTCRRELRPGRTPSRVRRAAGFEPGEGPQIAVLALEGSIDLELLHSGQSTPMRIRIVGTEDRLELRLTNTTPQIISIEGGDEGLVWTSGGADNIVERTVRGLQPGPFNITLRGRQRYVSVCPGVDCGRNR